MGSKFRLLIIDDREEDIRSLKRLFGKQYKILVANSIEEGSHILINSEEIHVAIIDMCFPEGMGGDKGGLKILETISRENLHTISIIFTAYPEPRNRHESLNLGATYYLQKEEIMKNTKIIDTVFIRWSPIFFLEKYSTSFPNGENTLEKGRAILW